MTDSFDFNTQTQECQYCKKRVACSFEFDHLAFCESEEGRAQFIPDSKYDYLDPKSSAINYLNYGAEKFGKDKPVDILLDGSMGSFAEDRTSSTIEECLKEQLYKLSFEEALRLISLAKCPLCHKTECICGTNYSDDEDDE